MEAWIKFVLVAIILDAVVRSYALKLYPFGSDAGDSSLPKKDDDANSEMILTTPSPFFGMNFTALYINENGIISFGTTLSDTTPEAFPLTGKKYAAAPYWADVLTKRGGRIWYRKTTENVTLSQRNTFQVLIASNGNMSFVGYLYDKLSWTTGTINSGDQRGLGGDPAKVGFSYGNSYHQIKVPGTVLNLVNTSNCGQPGVWFFRVDHRDDKMVDKKRCESEGSVSFYPTSRSIQTGANILITGLCYRPGSELLCEFGEAGTVKGNKFDESKAVCSVPFIATRKQVEFAVYPSEVDKLNFAKVFNLGPVHFYNTSVQLQGNSKSWISGNRVDISWNPKELADDQPVTVEIINLVDLRGTVHVHSNTNVVMEQPNTGRAQFDLPVLMNASKGPKEQKQVQMIRVRSIVKHSYSKYVAKNWIWSSLFLVTNHLLAHNSCSEWLRHQSESLSHRKGYQALTLCPKTERQMKADMGRFTVCDLCNVQNMPLCKMYYPRVERCYVTRPLSNLRFGRRCCYDSKGELTPGPPSVVSNQTNHCHSSPSVFSFFHEEIVPYLECCIFTDNCLKYQDLGSSGNESRYIPPNIGASFGDPHIVTFDGVEYTFNGFGEYTVLNVNNAEFILQGRMQPLNGGQSEKSPATVFTAFAMRQKGGSSIQVNREDIHSIILLIDGIRRVIEFGHELQSTEVLIRNNSRENHTRVVLAFTSGITVYIENAAVLQLAVTVPIEFKGKTSGLLGFWNDNSDEEYLLPNKEFLSTGSPMSQIHHHFGQEWVTKVNDSLFTYGSGEQHAHYFDSSYVPTFMEGYDPILAKMKSGVKQRALMMCEQSFQCVFDIAVTGREDIGQATKEFQEWLHHMQRNLHDEGCSAVLILEGGSVQTNVAGDITTHQFTCNRDYVMLGKDRISCRGGVWDGSKPRCYKAASVACKPLDYSIPNGNFHDQGNKLGDRYTFECDLPFTLIGNSEVVCGKDGLWSGQVPHCQRRNCSQVTINNSQVLVGNDGQLIVSCNEGYMMIGSSKISCLNNGLLNGKLPSCVKEQSWMAHTRSQTNIIPVVVIGVVVLIIVVIVVTVTICLVRRHHRRKDTQGAATEEPEEQAV